MISLISNPPFNIKWKHPLFAQLQPRFRDCEIPPESNANFAFILTALNKIQNKAALILPIGVLRGGLKEEVEIRKYLVEQNVIEAIILLPDNMFEKTSIATCIILLNKNKMTARVEMIDLRKKYEVEVREQNGQFGGAPYEKRTYKKEVKVFSDEIMDDAISCISENKDIPEYCKSVTIEQIRNEEYSLLASHYIELVEGENIHRDYGEIIDDLNRVIEEKNGLKITMNESLAKAIGLYDIYLMFKQSEKTNSDMNKALAFTGKEIKKENFISMSKKAGELKVENGRKNEVSTILMSILRMWKQHIMYLNKEENRYLIELRDALIPDLMSGKIELKED